MTDKATMPETIWATKTTKDAGDWDCIEHSPNLKHIPFANYTRTDKYDSLAAVAEEMSNAAALICMGYSNLDGQVELERALTSYNALMKGR